MLFAVGSINLRIVVARSYADTPVLLFIWSTDTVKAVPNFEAEGVVTIMGMFNSSSRLPNIGTHNRPRASVIMKFTISGVTFSAAITRSPSFSRLSSSTIIRSLPDCMSAIAFSTLINGIGSIFPYFDAKRQHFLRILLSCQLPDLLYRLEGVF